MEEEVDLLGAILKELFPDLLDTGKEPFVDITVDSLLVLVLGRLMIPDLFEVFRQGLGDVGFFKIDLDQPFPDPIHRLLIVFVFITIRQGAEGKFRLSIVEDPFAEVLHDVPLVVIYEYVNEAYQGRIVYDLPGKGDHPGTVQGDDAVLCMNEVFITDILQPVIVPFFQGLLQDEIQFLELIGRIIAQGGPCPLFLIKHFLYVLQENFRHLNNS
jgi:hypothetical protein